MTIHIEDVKKDTIGERKTCRINLSVTPTVKKFIEGNLISPQKVFDKTIAILMGEVK